MPLSQRVHHHVTRGRGQSEAAVPVAGSTRVQWDQQGSTLGDSAAPAVIAKPFPCRHFLPSFGDGQADV